MDELDLNVYHGYRDAVKRVIGRLTYLSTKPYISIHNRLPCILVDYHKWDVFYFDDQYKAKDFLEANYSSWDDEPPNGGDDDLVIFKFHSEKDMEDFPYTTNGAKLWREINGMKFYRSRSFVNFEPELIINISI